MQNRQNQLDHGVTYLKGYSAIPHAGISCWTVEQPEIPNWPASENTTAGETRGYHPGAKPEPRPRSAILQRAHTWTTWTFTWSVCSNPQRKDQDLVPSQGHSPSAYTMVVQTCDGKWWNTEEKPPTHPWYWRTIQRLPKKQWWNTSNNLAYIKYRTGWPYIKHRTSEPTNFRTPPSTDTSDFEKRAAPRYHDHKVRTSTSSKPYGHVSRAEELSIEERRPLLLLITNYSTPGYLSIGK